MKIYHGQRMSDTCTVTVDGQPLPLRSDLSGNATTAFDWGFIGGGPLALALLADHFGCDRKAKALSEVFEREVIAELPLDHWTLSAAALDAALAPLIGVDGARADDLEPGGLAVESIGDMPVAGADLALNFDAQDTAAVGSSLSGCGPLAGPGERPGDARGQREQGAGVTR